MKRLTITALAFLALVAFTAEAGNRNRRTNDCSLEQILLQMNEDRLQRREIDDLLFIREEEKLARDVYLSLSQRWEARVFATIAKAENNHMALVELLIDKYQLEDPVGANGVGVFTNEELQALYDDLTAAGNTSLEAALIVGATIEETDIADLLADIQRANNLDLDTLYQNLLRGSRNHLRAFVRQLDTLGVGYEPIVLSLETFSEIVSTKPEGGIVNADGDLLCGRQRSRSR
jgi:hypothetical protein